MQVTYGLIESRMIDEVFGDLRDQDRNAIESLGGQEDLKKVVQAMAGFCISQAVLDTTGKAIALVFAVPKYKGVFEISAYTANGVEQNKIGFFKAILRMMADFQALGEAHKIECVVWHGYVRSIKWLEKIGFEIEGYAKQHGPDRSDAILMGRTL